MTKWGEVLAARASLPKLSLVPKISGEIKKINTVQ
jgi:hypothetical protein